MRRSLALIGSAVLFLPSVAFAQTPQSAAPIISSLQQQIAEMATQRALKEAQFIQQIQNLESEIKKAKLECKTGADGGKK